MIPTPKVVTLGHAIVDVLATCDDELIAALGLTKGNMTLVDDDRAAQIYAALGPAVEASGGSAANTAAALASLGTPTQFVGKVGPDTLGEVFGHDIRATGVVFAPLAVDKGDTGRCLILVSPDAEKTMCTNLGIGAQLGGEDVDAKVVEAADVVYLEGYVCGKPDSAGSVEAAIGAARRADTLVAMSASDPGWVELFGDELRSTITRVDLLFANEHEALGLTGAADVDGAVADLVELCPTVVVTLGAEGCVVAEKGSTIRVAARAVERAVDTTGAGDSFAAGYLHGVVNHLGPRRSAELGALVAAEVVSHLGARPLVGLADLARQAGLLD